MRRNLNLIYYYLTHFRGQINPALEKDQVNTPLAFLFIFYRAHLSKISIHFLSRTSNKLSFFFFFLGIR